MKIAGRLVENQKKERCVFACTGHTNYTHAYRQIKTQTDRQTGIQTDREKDRQREIQTGWQIYNKQIPR